MLGDQAVAGSEVDAGLPFGSADLVFDVGGGLDGGYAHDKEPRFLLWSVSNDYRV
ncbi:hypothetical protein D3C71_2074430 [compost metagenome]